jgi:pimeloyl-ACP methyl ester carboxylesterase
MPYCSANGIELAYDTFGDPTAPTILLVMGLGMQLLGWEPEFCEQLAERGFHVVRYDNRDIGLSTGFDQAGVPEFAAVLSGDRTGVPYLLEDLAEDAAGLLAGLGVEAAHVVGVSMGGMIAQELAIRRPERVLSLCSIMSSTGSYAVGQPTPEAAAALTAPPGVDRDGALARGLRTWQVLQSPAYPKTDEEHLASLAAAYDRAYRPAASARQLGAILASPDRTEQLRTLKVPTQVIHGEADPLIDAGGGRATAEAIPDARLLLIPGMGHDMPEQLWDTYIDAIVANTRRAEQG